MGHLRVVTRVSRVLVVQGTHIRVRAAKHRKRSTFLPAFLHSVNPELRCEWSRDDEQDPVPAVWSGRVDAGAWPQRGGRMRGNVRYKCREDNWGAMATGLEEAGEVDANQGVDSLPGAHRGAGGPQGHVLSDVCQVCGGSLLQFHALLFLYMVSTLEFVVVFLMFLWKQAVNSKRG